ncbi:MAG: hypothetical protein DI549_10775 [Ancylobacter novellus]|uniref:DUF1833 domain-containing protein n=1 Tax=Ancylobacter novellus TaxID=921 RepID=A0A2W5SIJ1_ANCNO|nr:MAG: hypothetical protein DI549_10775 [Ancylobacter novellus]
MATINAAWAEAEASCPAAYQVIETIELQHPGLVDGANNPIPIRLVIDVMPRVLGIELGAVYNPGAMVEFQPTAIQCDDPEYAEGKMPTARLRIDNVTKDLLPHLDRATEYRADLKVLIRRYRSDDLALPIYGPVELVLTDITTSGSTVEGTATIADFGDRKVPSLIYSLSAFPGLQG